MLRSQIDQAQEWVAEEAGRSFREYMEAIVFEDDALMLCLESPLEAAFYVWWRAMSGGSNWFGRNTRLVLQHEVVLPGGRYRLDFAVMVDGEMGARARETGIPWTPIAVELDGHAFHEKTVEQVTRRNQRDRDLQSAGWMVFHISYDEMLRTGPDPVWHVFEAVYQQLFRIQREAR